MSIRDKGIRKRLKKNLLDLSSNSKDLNSLRCQEQRLTKLAEMIKNALNELGCEELPSGCDDLTVDQGFIDANGNVDQTVRQRLWLVPTNCW